MICAQTEKKCVRSCQLDRPAPISRRYASLTKAAVSKNRIRTGPIKKEPRNAAQFLIDEGREAFQRLLIAIAPCLEQGRDLVRALQAHSDLHNFTAPRISLV